MSKFKYTINSVINTEKNEVKKIKDLTQKEAQKELVRALDMQQQIDNQLCKIVKILKQIVS